MALWGAGEDAKETQGSGAARSRQGVWDSAKVDSERVKMQGQRGMLGGGFREQT